MKLERVLRTKMILAGCALPAILGAQTLTVPSLPTTAAQGQIGASAGMTPGASSATGIKSSSGPSISSGPIAVPEDFSKLKIAPGFLLTLNVFDEPDLSTQLRVDGKGNVTLPIGGNVNVAGSTLAEAQQKIESAFRSSDILKNPHVSLDISQYAPTIVTVLGEVHSPGRLQLQAPHSLLDVISMVGGETELAGAEIQIQHDENGHSETSTYHYAQNSDGSTISHVMVRSGDTITVGRAGIVYVLGAVNRPGGYLMQEDGKLDVAQALSLAMGTALDAKTKDIQIIRRRPDGTFVEFPFNYQKMVHGKIEPPQLIAQDIVYVPVSHFKASIAAGTGVIGQTAAASIYVVR